MPYPKEPTIDWLIKHDPFKDKFYVKDNYLIEALGIFGWDLNKFSEDQRRFIKHYYTKDKCYIEERVGWPVHEGETISFESPKMTEDGRIIIDFLLNGS